ncbi:MAG: class B sortase [Lachnospiraceae bacterium]|nr:class B sortase [Lachnospiraceae bacterium]
MFQRQTFRINGSNPARGGGSAAAHRFHDKGGGAEALPYTPAERAVRTADWLVDRFVDIVFILLLLIGLYFMYDSVYVFYNSRAAAVAPYRPENGDIAGLQQIAEDAVAWITLDDTYIDYPIMQGEDNREYLNKNAFGEYSLAGAIFMDSNNAKDFSDDYTVVYGHHMSGQYMFGALDAFADRTYFDKHRTGTLITERGEFPITVIAFFQTDASNSMVFNIYEDHSAMLSYLEQNADHYAEGGHREDGTAKRIVGLTTCKSPTTTKRTAVFVAIEE